VNPRLPQDVADFGATVDRAVRAAGGVELARRAETDPSVRTDVIPALLEPLGLGDLDPRTDIESALAAAQLARVAGANALPYPVAARLSAGTDGDARFIAVVDLARPAVAHADLEGPWRVIDHAGALWAVDPLESSGHRPPSETYDVPVAFKDIGEEAPLSEIALPLVLESWQMLGVAEAAAAMAEEHVQVRRQFDRPLSRFQGVQFHVSDLEVALRGLRQLAQFTAWRWFSAPHDALTDALALRVQAIETVRSILNVSHLLHGAVGFCDEHDLAVLDMAVTSSTRHPWDLEATTELLAQRVAETGFYSPFADPSHPTVEALRAGRVTGEVSS
jgi:hypothetical protein